MSPSVTLTPVTLTGGTKRTRLCRDLSIYRKGLPPPSVFVTPSTCILCFLPSRYPILLSLGLSIMCYALSWGRTCISWIIFVFLLHLSEGKGLNNNTIYIHILVFLFARLTKFSEKESCFI